MTEVRTSMAIVIDSFIYKVLKNNVYNISGMIEEVKTNMFVI